jgi:capsular polysaccharide biosynthesis protein
MSRIKRANLVDNGRTKEINLKEYYEVIKKRIWIIVILVFLTTLAGYIQNTYFHSSLYQTSTRLIIGSDSESMSTLMVMIKDPIIMEKVSKKLPESRSPEGLAGQITVERIDESQVIKLSVVDSDPRMAAEIANTTASVFKSEIVNILEFKDVQLLSEAKVNPAPINETGNRTILIAFILGLITGIGLAFLLDSLDGTVRSSQDIEEYLGVPSLGIVPKMNKKNIIIKKKKRQELDLRGETIGIK